MVATINYALVLLSSCVFYCNGINILFLEGVPSPSHHLWLSKVSIALAERGYNVTSLSADIDKVPTPNLHYLHLEAVYDRLYNTELEIDYFSIGNKSPWAMIKLTLDFSHLICEGAVHSTGWKQLQDYPDDFKFDLVLHDHYCGYCLTAFLKKFNYPPMISITASNEVSKASDIVRSALAPSTSTHCFYNKLKIDFLDRVDNYLMQVVDQHIQKWYINPLHDKIIRDQGKMNDILPTNELMRLSKLVMINYDPAIDIPEQFPPSVIPVGGLQIRPAKLLPEDLQTIADKAKNGLVLFSLGTNVPFDGLGAEKITHILEAFRKLPEYTFLCKFELENPPVPVPKNVITRKWIPQNDILGHNNTKLFITHSGLMSTQESIWHGVPMLGMPVFMDQFLNIDKAIQKGIAGRIFWSDLTAEILYTQIKTILTEPSYQKNMKIISNLFRDQKEPPLERAIWWIEWVLRNPNANHMHGVGDSFNFFQLQSVDVLAFISVVILLALWLLKVVCCFLLGCLFAARSAGYSNKTKKE